MTIQTIGIHPSAPESRFTVTRETGKTSTHPGQPCTDLRETWNHHMCILTEAKHALSRFGPQHPATLKAQANANASLQTLSKLLGDVPAWVKETYLATLQPEQPNHSSTQPRHEAHGGGTVTPWTPR